MSRLQKSRAGCEQNLAKKAHVCYCHDGMPSADASIFKTSNFNHKNLDYIVSAFTEPTNPDHVKIDVAHNGQPVVITCPDGFRATLGYHVDLENRIDMADVMGISAVDQLMKSAEADIRQLA